VTHKILIVDDEPNMLKMLGMTLEAAGFQIIVAQEAKSAWKKIADEAPDLVVLDIMMPGMDGLEFLRRLRLQPVTELLPVILLSALSAVDDKIAGLKAGADEYLTKPIDPREFVARITALLERTERLRESSSEQSAIIVSVIGVKGGVGTTRVASNIAGVLTTVNRQIILGELRPSAGTLARSLGLSEENHIGKLLGVDPTRINSKMLAESLFKHQTGMRVFCFPPTQEDVEPVSVEVINAIIEIASSESNILVLDLGSQFDGITHEVASISNAVLLVLEPTPISLDAARVASSLIKKWSTGASLIGCIVVNRSALASSITQGEIQEDLGLPILGVIPQAADVLSSAYRRGQLLVNDQESHMASETFKRIGTMLLEL